MTALVLPPDAARAVVGSPETCRNCAGQGCDYCSQTGVDTYVDAVARFIPSDTLDRYQPGEWIEVRVLHAGHRRAIPELGVAASTIEHPVGRVRLGEAVEVFVGSLPPRLSDVGLWLDTAAQERLLIDLRDDTDITVPHLALWPEAFTPGSWAYPIIERSPS